ncbi:MAG: DUF5673 domain-containing protein [Candidatus Hydrogenedentes bacterium]|nr:DUF5673 domain-containing protein [Candidatus Hydrogenedentota bacterium]
MALGRLQIREKGLWQHWSLLKWQKIESYEWKGESDCILMIQAKTIFPFLGRGALPIPIEQKAAVEKLLQAHVGPDERPLSQ